MDTEYAPLDVASYLDSEETIAEYLTAAAEDEDASVFMAAIAHVAKARGMAQVAEAAGLSRESLYKTLAPGAHPRFETIRAILRGLKVEIAVRQGSGLDSAPAALKPAVPPKKSVTREYIICLEDGKRFKSLKRHLKAHYNLSPEQYREKWGLPADYPMIAKAYAKERSDLAKPKMSQELHRKRRA